MVCYCVGSYNNDRLFGENGVVNNNGVVNDNGSLGINGSLNLSPHNPTSPFPHNPTPSPHNPTTPTTTPLSNWNLLRLSLSNWYSREIITLFDYFIFNEDVKSGSFVDISDYPRRVDGEFKKLTFYQGNYFYDLFLFMDNNVIVNNTVLGTKNRLNNDSKLENCFVGDGCTINGNISKCIVWDDIHINQDLDGYIVFSKDHKIPFTHLEIEMDLEEEVIDTTNFFDDLVGYLKDCLDSVRKDKIQIEEVIKQVNMLRIIWNASDLDLIEAFSVFLTDIVSPEDVEDSAINGSFFFPILENTVNTPKKQQELLVLIWTQMKDLDLDFKKNVFCIYAYQLFEDGVISRSVYKEYNMLVLKNLL
jgi:translation initiation factor eIF-2B subunit epsilon